MIVNLYKEKILTYTEQRKPIKHVVLGFSASVIFACSMEVAEHSASLLVLLKKKKTEKKKNMQEIE